MGLPFGLLSHIVATQNPHPFFIIAKPTWPSIKMSYTLFNRPFFGYFVYTQINRELTWVCLKGHRGVAINPTKKCQLFEASRCQFGPLTAKLVTDLNLDIKTLSLFV